MSEWVKEYLNKWTVRKGQDNKRWLATKFSILHAGSLSPTRRTVFPSWRPEGSGKPQLSLIPLSHWPAPPLPRELWPSSFMSEWTPSTQGHWDSASQTWDSKPALSSGAGRLTLQRGRRSSEKGGTSARRQLCVVTVARISRLWSCLSKSPGQAVLLVPLQEQETGAQRY